MAKIAQMQEVSLDLLKPCERNAKIHGEDQIRKLMNSIKEFGFISPCLVERDTFNLIAGHGRVEAAKRLGMKEVPCVFVEDLTDEQRRAYILADNRLSELGEWDMDMVNIELEELNDLDFDITLTGFDLDIDIDEPDEEDEKYTDVVNIPQYEPSGEPVALEDCIDTTKYEELLEAIEGSNLDEAEKQFLRLSAARHLAFSYKTIADYYASASAEMQELMEQSALVIIDVDDAIKNGYALLSGHINDMVGEDEG